MEKLTLIFCRLSDIVIRRLFLQELRAGKAPLQAPVVMCPGSRPFRRASWLGPPSERFATRAQVPMEKNRFIDFDQLFLGSVDSDRQTGVLPIEVRIEDVDFKR